MNIRELVRKWFHCWETRDYTHIPVAVDFTHTSPYGTINGKTTYLEVVKANESKFLDNQIIIHDEIYGQDSACVRYTIKNLEFEMEVSEWLFASGGLISRVISYYNIEGEIDEDRQLSYPANG